MESTCNEGNIKLTINNIRVTFVILRDSTT